MPLPAPYRSVPAEDSEVSLRTQYENITTNDPAMKRLLEELVPGFDQDDRIVQLCYRKITYTRLLTDPFHLRETILRFRAQGGQGLNITAPFKSQVIPYVHTLSEAARLAHAVNTLSWDKQNRLVGDNTDSPGFLNALERQGISFTDKKILILGAGGAARSVLAALLPYDNNITVWNRSPAKDLAYQLGSVGSFNMISTLDTAESFDLLINATSRDWPKPFFETLQTTIHPSLICYDLNYDRSGLTPFLQWCKDHGAQTCYDGYGMLVEQAALAFYLWEGIKPDTQGYY